MRIPILPTVLLSTASGSIKTLDILGLLVVHSIVLLGLSRLLHLIHDQTDCGFLNINNMFKEWIGARCIIPQIRVYRVI